MNCRAAEGMVNKYISRTLSVDELEEFLDHVEYCSSCYDELETYFIVHEVTSQLDNSSADSVLDFKSLLEQDLKRARRYVRKKRIIRFFEIAVLCVAAGVIMSLLILGFLELRQMII